MIDGLGSPVVRALDSRLDDREFDSQPSWLILGYRLWAGKPPQYFTTPPRLTQLPTLSRTENEYRPKSGDSLQLGCKNMYGSLHLWISVGGR